jgi:hypothetical protein
VPSAPTGSPPSSAVCGDGFRAAAEDCDDNNYQSLVDFLPGSVYSSSPDLANLLKLYTEGNGARRVKDSDTDIKEALMITEDEEEEEQLAVTVSAAVSGFNGGNDEDASSVVASASLHESGSSHV